MENSRLQDEFYFIIIKFEVVLKNSAINEEIIDFRISTFKSATFSSTDSNIIPSSWMQYESNTTFFAA
jgi:hypothetical protein